MKSSFTGSGTPTKTVDQNDSPPHVRAVTTSDIDLGVSQDAKKLLNQALLQITTNGKLKTVLAKGAAYESFP
ncbi:hypothetical protein ABTD06_18675, partial [Acinetobacter baumannii]